MATSYRVSCVEKDERIVAVGTGGSDGVANRRWTVAEVRRALGEGDRFYTVSPSTGNEADVEPFEDAIRTDPDQVTDNNLDDLRLCRWK
jgi:hypothetical protein